MSVVQRCPHGLVSRWCQACADSSPEMVPYVTRDGRVLDAARVWALLEADPRFDEGLREAEADLAAGLGVPFRPASRLRLRALLARVLALLAVLGALALAGRGL